MIVSSTSPRTNETIRLTTCFSLNSAMDNYENRTNQQTVYHLIPDTMFVKMNEVADAISKSKRVAIHNANKIADKKASKKTFDKFTKIAEGLVSRPEIVYKGNQRFNLEEVEFADSMVVSKKSNKGVRKFNHSAKIEVTAQ